MAHLPLGSIPFHAPLWETIVPFFPYLELDPKRKTVIYKKTLLRVTKLIFSLVSKGHGSSLSLVSTASSLYSSQEEKQASEIRKLKRELGEAHEKVNTLSGQLSTNVLPAVFFNFINFFFIHFQIYFIVGSCGRCV